jgi:hypothetical protein
LEAKLEIKNNIAILTTGRRFYCFMGLIGLNDEMLITEGFDDKVRLEGQPGEDRPHFTPQERTEIADYMIALWNNYKKAGG